MSTTCVRRWLREHMELLAGRGFSGLSSWDHIDHFLPKCKQGPDHPSNYVIMPASDNQHFGGVLSYEKCRYVRVHSALSMIEFNIRRLSREVDPLESYMSRQ